MKKTNIFNSSLLRRSALAACLLALASSANAFELPAGTKTDSFLGVDVKNITIEGDQVNVDLDLDFSQVKMKSNIETIYTPMFVNGTDTVRFESFAVTGRDRMYSNIRNQQNLLPLTFYKGRLLRPWETLETLKTLESGINSNLSFSTPYQEWLNTATFTVDVQTVGCGNCLKEVPDSEPFYPLAQNELVTHAAFIPEFLYITPVAEAVKTREISARAYIDFPVNRTEIYPDYRRNPQELAKIRATIDSVQNDKDIKVTSLHISGTASPEGSYQNNVRLAKGRTESLKNYVQGLYHFPAGFIATSFEPVDWQGLREFLNIVLEAQNSQVLDSIRIDQFQNIPGTVAEWRSVLPNASSILNIVNGSVEPVQKNNNIKVNYNKEYQWLLQNVYPALRHSDYRIQFEIRSFTEVSEIIEVMKTQPQKLSLAELFVAANSQPEGSELYNQAFELAVVMFPNDETANMNAGVNAMKRGDLVSAQKYMAKAGSTPEAEFNRAMLAVLQGDNETAKTMLGQLVNSSNAIVAAKAAARLEALLESELPDTFTFRPL